jgi:predicted transcriptional regulator YheO
MELHHHAQVSIKLTNLLLCSDLEAKQRKLAARLYQEGTSVKDLCQTLNIAKPTLYRYLRNET